MAPTPHHRFRSTLTGRIPRRSPRLKSYHRTHAPTRIARTELERLWRRLPLKATHDRGGERVPKTAERVARTAWVYVKFMQQAARAMRWWPGAYSGMQDAVAGGTWWLEALPGEFRGRRF